MRKFQTLFAAAITVSAVSFPAMADSAGSHDGFYIGAAVGYDSMPQTPLDINGFHVQSTWENGYGFLATGGYKFGFGVRVEAEFSYRQDHVAAFNTNPWRGTQWDNSLFANFLYDIDTGTAFTPYIGGGIGGAHISWGDNFRAASPIIYDASETKFGWQGIVGVAYAANPRLSITLDGRIKASNGYRFPGSAPGTVINHFNYTTHSAFLGFRYALD